MPHTVRSTTLAKTRRLRPPIPHPPQFAPAAGSYLLATRLTGRLYDKAAAAHGDPRECVGPDCFREAFLILAAMAAASALACVVCAVRSRGAYRAIVSHFEKVGRALCACVVMCIRVRACAVCVRARACGRNHICTPAHVRASLVTPRHGVVRFTTCAGLCRPPLAAMPSIVPPQAQALDEEPGE